MAAAALATGSDMSFPASTKRVSYILPPVQHTPRWLQLPSISANQDNLRGRSGPLLLPSELNGDNRLRRNNDVGRGSEHPRHTLPVTSLAIDTSTILADNQEHRPSGILYTGGRDGMIGAWELGLRMRRRKPTYRYDDGLEEEDDDEEEATLGLLDGVSQSTSLVDNQWEVDDDGGEEAAPAPAAKFRQCLGSHTDWINDIVLCNQNQTGELYR
jgi:WD repeat-containing protein 48